MTIREKMYVQQELRRLSDEGQDLKRCIQALCVQVSLIQNRVSAIEAKKPPGRPRKDAQTL